jgi:hypothetical protein
MVRHVTGWENVFRMRLEGRPVTEPEKDDFPPVEDISEESHFLLLTFWDSIEAIKRFAGEDAEQARYYLADEEYLL